MGTKRVGLARVEALIENLKRDLALGGGSISGQKKAVLTTTADTTLTDADSGKLILLNGAVTHDVTLPSPAAGLNFKFVLIDATADVDVVQAGASDDFKGGLSTIADAAGDTPAAGDTKIVFDQSGGAAIGDTVSLECDGTNWFVSGVVAAALGVVFHGA